MPSGGNGRSRGQRIRLRFKPLPPGEAVRLPRHLGAACAQKRRQAGEKEKAEQREHPCGGGFAYGGAGAAPHPDGPRSVLSKSRATPRRRHCRLRYRQKVGYACLPAAAMGPAVRGRRGSRIRKPISPAPHRTFGGHSQRTRLPADSRKCSISTLRKEKSQSRAEQQHVGSVERNILSPRCGGLNGAIWSLAEQG